MTKLDKITLRDIFAACALVALADRGMTDFMPKHAYAMADEMLKLRASPLSKKKRSTD